MVNETWDQYQQQFWREYRYTKKRPKVRFNALLRNKYYGNEAYNNDLAFDIDDTYCTEGFPELQDPLDGSCSRCLRETVVREGYAFWCGQVGTDNVVRTVPACMRTRICNMCMGVPIQAFSRHKGAMIYDLVQHQWRPGPMTLEGGRRNHMSDNPHQLGRGSRWPTGETPLPQGERAGSLNSERNGGGGRHRGTRGMYPTMST
jgi:hypothetical protein